MNKDIYQVNTANDDISVLVFKGMVVSDDSLSFQRVHGGYVTRLVLFLYFLACFQQNESIVIFLYQHLFYDDRHLLTRGIGGQVV